MSNYLDSTGLAYFWGKIKDRLNQKADYDWTVREASGDLVRFDDGAETLFSKLKVNITPDIGRRGDIGPTNPRPLAGFTSVRVTGSGKNLFDPNNWTKSNISCTESSGSTTGTVIGVSQNNAAWVPLPGGVTYAITCTTHSTTAFRITATAEFPVSTNAYKTPILLTISDPSADTILFTAPAGTRWIGITLRTASSTDVATIEDGVEGLQIEAASEASVYEAFRGGTLNISLPTAAGTVYAGTLDVIGGVLTVTHQYMEFDGTETWQENTSGTYPYFWTATEAGALPKNNATGLCSHFDWAQISGSNQNTGVGVIYGTNQIVALRPGADVASTVAELTSWLAGQASAGTPLQVVYPLNTPIVYKLAGNDLSVLDGANRVWSRNGGTEVGYTTGLYAKVKNGDDGVRSMIASGETGMAASKNYTAGERFAVGNVLYRATANIASGEAIVPGTNVTATTIADELNAIMPALGVSF